MEGQVLEEKGSQTLPQNHKDLHAGGGWQITRGRNRKKGPEKGAERMPKLPDL